MGSNRRWWSHLSRKKDDQSHRGIWVPLHHLTGESVLDRFCKRLLPLLMTAIVRAGHAHHEPGKPRNGTLPKLGNWVQGLRMCIYCATTVLILNFIFTIIASAIAFGKFEQPFSVSSTIYEGSCTTAKNTTMGTHFVINVLSTLMLGAGNYCM